MPTTKKSSWFVPPAFYMTEVPDKRTDLLREVHDFHGHTEPQVFFDTETEAEVEAIRRLINLKGYAEATIKAYSKPPKSVKKVSGSTRLRKRNGIAKSQALGSRC